MTVKEAMAILGVNDKRIYTLLRMGKITAVKGEPIHPGGRPPWIITSTEEELRRANEEVKTVPRTGTTTVSKTATDYVTLKQLGKMLGVSYNAARSRVRHRGFEGKCIRLGKETGIPRKVAELLVKQGYIRTPGGKKETTATEKTTTKTVVNLGNGWNTRMERIETLLGELKSQMDTLLKMWMG